jgi:ketosteroid isomerase-like protein
MTPAEGEANKALVRRFLSAYVQGDHETALGLLDDEAVWTLNALPGHFRFGGRWVGKTKVHEGLSLVAADYTIHRYDIVHLMGEGETVWTTSKLLVTQRKTGKELLFEIAGRWKLRDGKIVEATEYFDSAAVLNQQGDLPHDIQKPKE